MASVIMSLAVGLALAAGAGYLVWSLTASHRSRLADRRARAYRLACWPHSLGWPHEDVTPGEAPMIGAFPGHGYINPEED